MSLAAAGEMIVTAEVPKMAAHSATVAWRKRGHSESEVMCRGNSSPRVIRGRRQTSELRLTEAHLCRDVFTGFAEELIPTLLGTDMQVSHCSPKCDRRHAAATTPQNPFQSTCFPHLPQLWRKPIVLDHPLWTNEWKLAGFSSRGRCVGGSSERSNVRSLV